MTQRTALVTGASRGIGKAIASKLAAEGHRVIGTATTANGASEISAYLGQAGRGLTLKVDDQASVNELVENLNAEDADAVSILVNNAGITRDNLLLRMSDQDWESVLQTNLVSLHRITKPFLRGMMRERWGRIVTIGSVVGSMGNAGQANYATSKAGIEGFTRSLSLELGSRGITVNCVAPGFIETDMTADLNESVKEQMLNRIPLGRMGTPDDVAETVSFLVSTSASYISGQTLGVNGGLFPH